jgi:hypothetical protein
MSIRFSTAFESYGFFIPPAVAAVAAFLVMGEPFEFKLSIYCSHTGFIHCLCRIEVERIWKAKERKKNKAAATFHNVIFKQPCNFLGLFIRVSNFGLSISILAIEI